MARPVAAAQARAGIHIPGIGNPDPGRGSGPARMRLAQQRAQHPGGLLVRLEALGDEVGGRLVGGRIGDLEHPAAGARGGREALRGGAGLECPIIGRAYLNDVYDVFGVEDGWYRIDYKGAVGYVFGDLVSEKLAGNV